MLEAMQGLLLDSLSFELDIATQPIPSSF